MKLIVNADKVQVCVKINFNSTLCKIHQQKVISSFM